MPNHLETTWKMILQAGLNLIEGAAMFTLLAILCVCFADSPTCLLLSLTSLFLAFPSFLLVRAWQKDLRAMKAIGSVQR